MNSKGYVHHAMKNLFNSVGVPQAIVFNFAVEKVQGEA